MVFAVFYLYNFIFEDINLIIVGFGVLCVIIGSILPDADIEDGKSKIFYMFFPIAIVVRLLEYPLAFMFNKRAKHRGVLHSHVGIVFSSLIAVMILSVVLYFIKELSLLVVVYMYILTFLSQELHLFEDKFSDNWIYIIIIIVLVIVSYFFMKPL